MLYSKKELEMVKNIIDGEVPEDYISILSKLIEDDLPSVSNMVDKAIVGNRKKHILLAKIEYIDDEGNLIEYGYAIKIENEKRTYFILDSVYYLNENGTIPVSMLKRIVELSEIGYVLKHNVENEIYKLKV